MRIGIIGTGTVGATLGKRWAATGHEVMFGAREPGSAKVTSLVAAAGVKTRAGSVAEAARFGEVVVLATPFDATEAAIRQAGDLAGRVVIDCTNPLKPDLSGLEVGFSRLEPEVADAQFAIHESTPASRGMPAGGNLPERHALASRTQESRGMNLRI